MSPYRESGGEKEPLQMLRERIEEEKKIGIRLPENVRKGEIIEDARHALELQIDPSEIILYSIELGLLKFHLHRHDLGILQWIGERDDKGKEVAHLIQLDEKTAEVKMILRNIQGATLP